MAEVNRAFDYTKYREWIDPKDVIPYENNAKMHPPEQVHQIANSIKRFGWQQDTVITADNVVVVGHGRRLAALELGCKMPFHRVGKNADELTEAEIKALRLADNKTAESGMDFGKLKLELDDLKDFGMSDFGFTMTGSGFMNPVSNDYDEEGADDLPDYGDEGFEEYQEPLSKDELAQYSENADQFLLKRRVIITFLPEQEEEIKRLLGITDEKMRVVYDLDELLGVDEE